MQKQEINDFKKNILNFYLNNKRNFAWRETYDPYHILVSEIMLQQTQTFRVVGKFEMFINKFPDFPALAQSSTQELLLHWQGLGYNRRALALREIAKRVISEFNGALPDNPEILKTFKGIGPNTAGSICAFAFNKPVIFIETNIRAVFIYHFFQSKMHIHDKEILPLVSLTLDKNNPREWYYALMDYGVMIKKQFKNPAKKSVHYTKQSEFQGSDRQIRGNILKLLTKKEDEIITVNELITLLSVEKDRLDKIINELASDNFIHINQQFISLK